jgi:hypothetical protein
LERTLELDALVAGNNTQGLETDRFGSRSDAYANYYNYDAHFLLMFRAGQPPDPETGFQTLNFRELSANHLAGSVYFAAVYQTVEVTHVFSNGTFTQKIKAIRDGLINLQGLRSNNAPTPPATPAAPAAPPAAPPAVSPAAPTLQPASSRPPSPSEVTRRPNETTSEFNARVRAAADALARWNAEAGLRQSPPMASE